MFQPEWSPDGALFFASDRTGWWNLYRAPGGAASAATPEALWPMEVEFGKPQWTFSQSAYWVIDAGRLATTFNENGRWRLGMLQLNPRRFERLDLPLEPTDGVVWHGGELFAIGGSPTRPLCVARIHGLASTPQVEVIRHATADRPPDEWISPAQSVTFPSDGRDVHAFFYAPRNPDYVAADGELPPLMVLSHGGPTAREH